MKEDRTRNGKPKITSGDSEGPLTVEEENNRRRRARTPQEGSTPGFQEPIDFSCKNNGQVKGFETHSNLLKFEANGSKHR